jgi:hypothetical protein
MDFHIVERSSSERQRVGLLNTVVGLWRAIGTYFRKKNLKNETTEDWWDRQY